MNIIKPKLIYPPDGYIFDTHTDIQNEFKNNVLNNGTDFAVKQLEAVKCDNECSYPQSLTFKWAECDCKEYVFEISKNIDFADAFTLKYSNNFCTLTNFEIGTKYFWRINGGCANSFTTKNNCFRFIKIDGALNVRDLGGNKIKQGLIYRGSDLKTNYKITDAGRNTFLEELKIKSEVELRKEVSGEVLSALGKGVIYRYLPYRPYREIFDKEHLDGICKIMEFLAEKNNYPIYIHCLGGADRTAMIAIFLRAIAGEADEIIHLDYELTSLSTYAYGLAEGATEKGIRKRTSEYYKEFLSMLDKFAPDKPLADKVYNFLLYAGVKSEIINIIKSIITI